MQRAPIAAGGVAVGVLAGRNAQRAVVGQSRVRLAHARTVAGHDVQQDLAGGEVELAHQLQPQAPPIARVVLRPADVACQVGAARLLRIEHAVDDRVLECLGAGIFVVEVERGVGAAPVDARPHQEDVDRFPLPELLHGARQVPVVLGQGARGRGAGQGGRTGYQRRAPDPCRLVGDVGEFDADSHRVRVGGVRCVGAVAVEGTGNRKVGHRQLDAAGSACLGFVAGGGDQLAAAVAREGARVCHAEVGGAPVAVLAVQLQHDDPCAQGVGLGLPAMGVEAHAVAVPQPEFGERGELPEALSRGNLHQVAGGERGTDIVAGVRLPEDRDVAPGLRVPAGHVVVAVADRRAVPVVAEGVELEGRVDQQVRGGGGQQGKRIEG